MRFASRSLLSLSAACVCACGGIVVFDEGAAGGGGAPSVSAQSGQSAQSGTSGPSVVTGTSVTSGPSDPCLNLPCGVECVVCNDVECLQGFCDEQGACGPELTCKLETFCYVPDAAEPCVPVGEAEWRVCPQGGKGRTVFGTLVEGPFLENGSCCYLGVGDCIPNP